ncbi:MAG: SDR family NAD(P)-dependent oxidoreductase, partial [Acidimicrobiales bacterium]
MELKGRAAIVTGGAGGLGSATVRRLIEAGMRVVIFDRDGDRAEELAGELGAPAVAVTGDATTDEDVGAAVDAARHHAPLTVLVNVAGGGVGGGRTVGR